MKSYEIEIKLTTVRKVKVVAPNQNEAIEFIDDLIASDEFDLIEVEDGEIEIMIGEGKEETDTKCENCNIVALCCPSQH